MTSPLTPECRGGVHAHCASDSCQCPCHEVVEVQVQPLPAATIAGMAGALAFIVERHRPDMFNASVQGLTCQACSLQAGIPVPWPCPERAVVGRLLPDPSNRLLPDLPGPGSPVGAGRSDGDPAGPAG